jgi:hypothetical protein
MSELYRIVFVTGMKPKPPPDDHKAVLLRALEAGLERVRPAAAEWLAAHGDRFTLVSWTHLLYGAVGDLEPILPGLERLMASPVASAEERHEIDSLQRRLKRRWHLVGESVSPLTSLIADKGTELLLADVHRYLRNEGGIGVTIRALLKSVLEDAWSRDERVLLICHSLGSVIAYDCLWELSREAGNAGRIEQLVTLGSPLATRFIRRSLKGADRPPPERYPANIRRWANFSARGELVALHPRLEPFFRGMVEAGLIEAIEDHIDLYNHFHDSAGINPHRSYGYLIHEKVAGLIGDRLSS